MRIVFLLILFLVIIGIFAVIYTNIIGYLFQINSMLNEETGKIVKNLENATNKTITVTNYDLVEKTKPAFNLLDIALAVGIIFLFAGIFFYTRKR